jgi:hypothetical protein
LNQFRLDAVMTHEEMAQRISSSSSLSAHDGDTPVIRNHPARETLALRPFPQVGGWWLLSHPPTTFS